MRLAVFADVHGNADALTAVLADISHQAPDLIVNLGDCLSGPTDPAATADTLMARPDILTVRGNHDRLLVDETRDQMGSSDGYAADRMTHAHRDWLADLPVTLDPLPGVLACHATPEDDMPYWVEALTPEGHVMPAPEADMAAIAGDHPAQLFLCGHTHLPRAVRLLDGRQIVNPGSVGCPAYTDTDPVPHVVQSGFPEASYAILDQHAGGWQVQFRRIPYDTTRMVAIAHAAGRPDWAQALATGWIT